MAPSATLCRAQEAVHRRHAAATTLENVRLVSERAAAAWSKEALCAEGREFRQSQTRSVVVPARVSAG